MLYLASVVAKNFKNFIVLIFFYFPIGDVSDKIILYYVNL